MIYPYLGDCMLIHLFEFCTSISNCIFEWEYFHIFECLQYNFHHKFASIFYWKFVQINKFITHTVKNMHIHIYMFRIKLSYPYGWCFISTMCIIYQQRWYTSHSRNLRLSYMQEFHIFARKFICNRRQFKRLRQWKCQSIK